MVRLLLVSLLLGLSAPLAESQGQNKVLTLSAIFDEDEDSKQELAFKHIIGVVNRNRDILRDVELRLEVRRVPKDNTFLSEKVTCSLLEKGTVAIFGPTSKANSEHIKSICDSVEIPFIETRWNYRSQNILGTTEGYAFNLHPDITSLGSAYLDVIEMYDWKTITILYQDNDSLMTLKEIFSKTAKANQPTKFQLVVKQLIKNDNGYRDVLNEIFISGSNLIVLDCEKDILAEVLKQCQQVGLISQGYYFLLTSLDAHVVDLQDFKYGGTNFTALRMVDLDRTEVQNVIFSIVENLVSSDIKVVPDGNLDTATALIHDSVYAYALALNELTGVQQVRQQAIDCSGRVSWPNGNSLINYMKMVEFVGLTGPVKFDASGLRTEFALSLMELQNPGLTKVGYWNSFDRLVLERMKKEDGAFGNVHPMANKTFVITTVLNDPYTMLVQDENKLSGNKRFEGFTVDLATELSKILHFNFTFKLVDDGQYGKETSSGNWNGMIGEVLDGRADFAIADISITTKRASAVKFTMPWMNVGISILFVRPRPAPPSMLAFLDPFTIDVYLYTILVFVFVTIVIYVLARFSPNQWEEPSNCMRDPEEYTNQYNLLNSFWFTMGALMQQGSDVAPIALCVRFAAGMWFFFALIMISSYTANLAAFLTVETLERPIENADDLAKQNVIKYGALNGGSTAGFFEMSNVDTYQRLWQFMSGIHRSEVMVSSNNEGVEKVEQSNGMYAYFMESSSIEYLVERRCKLGQVGGLLDSKGYGIVTKPGTPYKSLLDNAILKLMEGGNLHKLRVKWWKQKRGGGSCDTKEGGGGVNPLGLENVAGVFVVTILGCMIASVFAILEFFIGTRQSAKENDVSWKEEIINEMRFILLCHGNTKEVHKNESELLSKLDEPSHSSSVSLESGFSNPHHSGSLITIPKVANGGDHVAASKQQAASPVSSTASPQDDKEDESSKSIRSGHTDEGEQINKNPFEI